MRPIAVIQARLSSQRLPGKVLADVAGRTLIGRLLDRLAGAALLRGVVVATSAEASDDALARWCEVRGVACHRGALADVAGRVLAAGRGAGADPIVRVCADSPVLDPDVVDRVVERYLARRPDLATNVFPRTYPAGQSVEAIDPDALARARASMTEEDREHVTRRFYREPQAFRIENVAHARDCSAARMTVDTPDDLALARAVLAGADPDAGWEALLRRYEASVAEPAR